MKLKVKHLLSQCLFLLLMVGMSSFAMAQSTVTGKVTDDSGEGLIGASVLVKGTTAGTLTDAEGNYSVSVPEGGTTLVFSYTGYGSKEVEIAGQSTINVTMIEGVNVDELVVVGYGAVKKSDLTGAVVSVKEEDFNQGIITAPDQLIQGKVAGVQLINNSGQPGGATTVRIRGNSSVRAGNQPLYVVDGIPLDSRDARPGRGGGGTVGNTPGANPLNFLNPNDIASVEVLKDASAAAIYGSRGANGVVIITTKKGRAGAPTLDFNASFGNSSILKKYEVLDGNQYRQALNDYNITAGDFGDNVDAMDAILQNGLTQNYGFSIGGGSDLGNYRISAGYLNQEGIIKESDFKKYTGSINGSYKFLDSRLTVDFGLSAAQTVENVAPIGSNAGFVGSLVGQALQWNPTEALYDANGVNGFNIDVAGNSKVNPVATLAAYDDVASVSTILGSISPAVKLADGLEYRMLYSIKRGLGNRRNSIASWINMENIQGNGVASVENTILTTQQITHTLNYNKQINENLSVNALVGYEYQKYENELFGMAGIGFFTDELDYTYGMGNTDQGTREIYSYADPTNELQSYFGRGIFNIQDKYVVTATLRYDGSSKLGADNPYDLFPAVAVAWNLDKEGFLPSSVDAMKLRVSWGQTGNQEFPAGAATDRFIPGPNRTFTQANGGNSTLIWETVTSFNVGLDFAILDYVLSGSIDYFDKSTENLLFPQTLASPGPGSIIWKNLPGNVRNNGVELALTTFLVNNDDFNWRLTANATFQSNIIENYNELANIELGELFGQGLSGATSQRLANNQPLNVWYLPVFTGLDDQGFSVLENDGARQYFASPNPTTILGISTYIEAGDFSAGLNFNGAFGHYIYNNTANAVLAIGNLGSRNIDAALIGTGESIANVPSPSTRYLEKGDYLKLANMTLAYNVGDVSSLKNVRVSLTGQNLLVFTNYSGFDPEVNTVNFNDRGIPSTGIEYTPYPSARTILFGVSCSL